MIYGKVFVFSFLCDGHIAHRKSSCNRHKPSGKIPKYKLAIFQYCNLYGNKSYFCPCSFKIALFTLYFLQSFKDTYVNFSLSITVTFLCYSTDVENNNNNNNAEPGPNRRSVSPRPSSSAAGKLKYA